MPATKVAGMKSPEESLRVYISGGGCSGFNYGFKLDEKTIDGDFSIEKNGGVTVLSRPYELSILRRNYNRLFTRLCKVQDSL